MLLKEGGRLISDISLDNTPNSRSLCAKDMAPIKKRPDPMNWRERGRETLRRKRKKGILNVPARHPFLMWLECTLGNSVESEVLWGTLLERLLQSNNSHVVLKDRA